MTDKQPTDTELLDWISSSEAELLVRYGTGNIARFCVELNYPDYKSTQPLESAREALTAAYNGEFDE